MNPVICQWPCLNYLSTASDPKPDLPKTQKTQSKSFVQALNSSVCDIPASQLPQPVIKGDRVSITIPEEDYIEEMEACKHSLHARIIYPKGATPLTVYDLKGKLSAIWKEIGIWGISTLGMGYYEFTFSSLEDMRRVRSIGSWNLNPGFIKFFAWTRDFNPRTQQNTSAQVWVRFYGVPQEYWRPRILFAIASSVGSVK
jgi:hypothetical protein